MMRLHPGKHTAQSVGDRTTITMAASASDMRPAGVAQEAMGLSGVMTCFPMTGSHSSSRSRLPRGPRSLHEQA